MAGTTFYTPKDVILEEINSRVHVKLLKPKFKLRSSISATIARKVLSSQRRINNHRNSGNQNYGDRRWKWRNEPKSTALRNSPKLVILSYEEYCHSRKLKAALETSVAVRKDEAINCHLVSEPHTKVLFCQKSFSSRNIGKWCNEKELCLRRGKYALILLWNNASPIIRRGRSTKLEGGGLQS